MFGNRRFLVILFLVSVLLIPGGQGCGPTIRSSSESIEEPVEEPARSEDAEDPAIYVQQGQDYVRQGEYWEAVDAYSQALELDPEYVSAYVARGNAYSALEEYNAAIDDYVQALDLDPDHDVVLNNLAYLYADVLETNLEEATDLAYRALELEGDGNNRAIYLDTLGWTFYKRGMLDEAYEVLAEAIDLEPDHPEIVQHWELVRATVEGIDTDGDGVPDQVDQCPGTPSGVAVDSSGCELVYDSDDDGVSDDEDRCPDTPRNVEVDSEGCELVYDSDDDGVSDDEDRCPDTPRNVEVDSEGCELVYDSDDDGVSDDEDRCPDTPRNVEVDSEGCELVYDSDDDGVSDDEDRCPDTPRNVEVDSRGCEVIYDSDNDGIPDEEDQCPNTPAGTMVDRTGCQQARTGTLTLQQMKELVKRVEPQANHSRANIEVTLQRADANNAWVYIKFRSSEDEDTYVYLDLFLSVADGSLKVGAPIKIRIKRDAFFCDFDRTWHCAPGMSVHYSRCATEVINKNCNEVISNIERELATEFLGSIQGLEVQGDRLLITYYP